MPSVVAVIQARMGSTRLPGKVLKPLAGEPMLARILQRLEPVRQLEQRVVATTTNPSDDPVETFGQKRDIPVYRGSVDDLAERIWRAGQSVEADVIVRIWGDCPFVEPAVVSDGIEAFLDSDSDYLTNSTLIERTFPAGLDFEIYDTRVLRDIVQDTEDSFYREFPGEYVTSQDKYRIRGLRHERDLSSLHLTVDYPADFELAERIYRALQDDDEVFGFEQIIELLRSNPEWTEQTEKLARNADFVEKKDEHQPDSTVPEGP